MPPRPSPRRRGVRGLRRRPAGRTGAGEMWQRAQRSRASSTLRTFRTQWLRVPLGGFCHNQKEEEPMARKPSRAGAATSRRTFLRTGLVVGAGTVGAGLLATGSPAVARASSSVTTGDVDILRFLAAIEII